MPVNLMDVVRRCLFHELGDARNCRPLIAAPVAVWLCGVDESLRRAHFINTHFLTEFCDNKTCILLSVIGAI